MSPSDTTQHHLYPYIYTNEDSSCTVLSLVIKYLIGMFCCLKLLCMYIFGNGIVFYIYTMVWFLEFVSGLCPLSCCCFLLVLLFFMFNHSFFFALKLDLVCIKILRMYFILIEKLRVKLILNCKLFILYKESFYYIVWILMTNAILFRILLFPFLMVVKKESIRYRSNT